MKTFSAKAQDIERKWYVIDAADKVLGRVAVEAANLLRGKNKTIFTPTWTAVIMSSFSTPTKLSSPATKSVLKFTPATQATLAIRL